MKANVYRLPASLSTTGAALPCSFAFGAAQTPTLTATSSTQLVANATLTLTGSGLATGTAAPTVAVCAGLPCAVMSFDDTSISCTMPECASSSTEPIMVHVPPYGYASQDGSLFVQGVLSVTALSGPVGAGVPAKGSAAGGVRLTVSGSGFEPNATHMKVTLRLLTRPRTTPFTTLLSYLKLVTKVTLRATSSASTDLAECTVLSSGQATLVCVTRATASPEADSGTLTTLRVAVLDAAGGEVSSASLADSYMLRPLSELPWL